VAETDFVVPYGSMAFMSDGEQIVKLPPLIKAGGSLDLKFVDKTITVQKGDRPELSEEQLRDIASTVELHLSMEILQSVSSAITPAKV